MFGFLHRRDGVLPQPLLRCVGAHGPLFSARWPMGLFPSFTAWVHGAQAWDNDRQVVEQGQWQAGAARGAVPAPPTTRAESSLMPFLPASLILSCPGAEAFCISQKPDSPQR